MGEDKVCGLDRKSACKMEHSVDPAHSPADREQTKVRMSTKGQSTSDTGTKQHEGQAGRLCPSHRSLGGISATQGNFKQFKCRKNSSSSDVSEKVMGSLGPDYMYDGRDALRLAETADVPVREGDGGRRR